jgi:predicted nucleotidyltransferase
MNSGEYYPKAVSNSAKELFSDEMASIFDGANNILGIEYIKALKGTNITPVTFSREGSNHDSNIVSSNIASGSYIREHFNDRNSFMPDYKITDTANIEEIEKIIIYKFSQMTLDEIKNTPDVIEGFENRISEKVQENSSFTELCNSLKTKRYTMARIRRILCCGLLGITKEIRNIPVPYIRVLGFSQKGEKLLKEISKTASLPLITNVKKGYDNLDKTGKKVLDIEILATKLWSLASNHTNLSNDFKQKIIK